LGLVGVVAAMMGEGFGDGAALLACVPEVLVPERRPGQVVGLDHLKAHQVVGGREALEAVGARRLSRPPSSPDCSPLEACWSTSKALVRTQAARTLARLWPASTDACAAITSQEAQGWCTHAGDGVQSN
jgi:hypothetical protein